MQGFDCSMALMPIIGASVHIVQKFLFECQSSGVLGVHEFYKPIFFTWLGSLGLFLEFVFYLVSSIRPNAGKSNCTLNSFLLLSISTLFNLIAGALSNISSLYLNYSVSLMLRSSTLLFGALISTFYQHRRLSLSQWIGITLVLVALFLVSAAALLGGSQTTHLKSSASVQIAFVVVRIASKSLQAISALVEEKVIKKNGLSPLETSSLSGIWSLFFSSLLFFLPFEDISDTVAMIKNSNEIKVLCLLSVAVYALYNILALSVTAKASAIARILFDQLTIVVVWATQLFIFFFYRGTRFEKAGESWTAFSWLQLLGFAVMVAGSLVYQGVISVRMPVSPLAE